MFDRIVVVGAGRTSGSIIERLARLAPLTVLDTSQAALDALAARPAEDDDAANTVIRRVADGTSRIVLEDLRGDPKSGVAMVVAIGDDRSNLEACRLASELDYKPIVAVVNDASVAQKCEEHGARALVRAHLIGQLVEQSLQQGGVAMASTVGFGRGEILEFRVLPSSPAIGVPLSQLRADGWRIAAIYRGDSLVLPTGTTTIAADDRVLVIGDPKQLPHVAESLRVGLPTFPLLHGPHVVVYLPDGRDRSIEPEAEVLTLKTRAARLVRVYPEAAKARSVIEAPLADGTTGRKHFDDAPLTGDTLEAHLALVRTKQPGVVVTRMKPRSFGDVVFGRGGRESTICNTVGVPVLFPKGAPHYERVVAAVADGSADMGAAEVALDLARMFGIPFCVMRTKVPTYLQTPDPTIDKLVDTIANRARLHGVIAEMVTLEGNPIAEWIKSTRASDLSVVARRPTLRDSFSSPDLALRFARDAEGSVLVVTVER